MTTTPQPQATREHAEKELKKAHDAQPMNAAKGAVVGGVAAETVALGAMYIKLVGEMIKNANQMGISIAETRNPHIGQHVIRRMFSNPKSLEAFLPFVYGMVAAPFIGSAAGAWLNTRWGNQTIDKAHDTLEQAQQGKWQEKIAADHAARTSERVVQ